jgi:NADH:ubiquinone oxidoreductase subunit 2 (subunit N)
MRRQAAGGADQPSSLAASSGLAWRTPLGVALFVLGCVSLAGLPLTPGFRSHWEIVSVVGRESPALAALAVLPIAGAVVAILRAFVPLLRAPEPGESPSVPETPVMRAVAGLLLATGLLLAVAPQLLLSFSRTIAGLF